MSRGDFSFLTRRKFLKRLESERFDFLIIGGGITGAAVARDAASRGLRVALVEQRDFAFGTSSRSSKLIHGGLRYLENFEFGLVFEALAERSFLLKKAPHRVRPLPFFLPVYQDDPHGVAQLSMGLWLYDLLALFRAPGFHRKLSRKKIINTLPSLAQEGLVGGFTYFDASMWDEMLVVETLRSAVRLGAVVCHYTEAVKPIFEGSAIAGFCLRDSETGHEFEVRAERVLSCVGPWSDELGKRIDPEQWRPWLKPSQGVHLVFDLKLLPLPGALVMSHPEDGRISFVIPRHDLGNGVTLVGTTDGPVQGTIEVPEVRPSDVSYLMDLLHRYFPNTQIQESDILSAYVGVRPLVGGDSTQNLQKVSREHSIERGPGGITLVAGGKYTTHRKMAEEIVDFTLNEWKKDCEANLGSNPIPEDLIESRTDLPVNPQAITSRPRRVAAERDKLFDLYGSEASEILRLDLEIREKILNAKPDPEGFPALLGQLLFSMRHLAVLHLEDFYFRRSALFLARKDHGLPWAESMARAWAIEQELDSNHEQEELARLRAEINHRNNWRKL